MYPPMFAHHILLRLVCPPAIGRACSNASITILRACRTHLYRIRRCVSHPLEAVFQKSIARQPRECLYRTSRPRKAVGEMLPTSTFVAPALFRLLRRYRAMENRSRGCDIHRRIRYVALRIHALPQELGLPRVADCIVGYCAGSR